MTKRRLEALEILAKHGPLRPREFARFFWPGSPGWTRAAKCGANGSHRGGGMYLAGGGYLGKLWHLGLVRGGYPEGFFLTDAGRKALEQAAA